ncbi:HEAT repeat domain-containing protein [Altericista sp. CCNU0014]|uniref:HEAT repeat domain-containing protein n=1 Tax=Altericista sp. CCNU0014 TaxID=3082949 RepID=UPI00384CBB76
MTTLDPSEDFQDAIAPTDRPLTTEQAIANLKGTDSGDRYYAAWWLGRFRVRTQEAVDALVATLLDESDRTPEGGYPLRRNSARALGKLGDGRAVPALIECLACSDYYVREAAAQSLGALGDRACSSKLIALLDGGVAAAQPIPNCPHLAQPYDAVLEALGTLGERSAIAVVEPFLEHSMELVQYAAARAMYQLTGDVSYGDRLVAALGGDKLQLRRAALADIGAIGYLKAAQPVAQTLAENSLKLISLKGILEHQIEGTEPLMLSEEAIQVMQLMDGLL